MRRAAVFVPLGIAFAASLLIERHSVLALPTPSGPFAVGRTMCWWMNAAIDDELAPSPGTKREFAVWIWYPAIRMPDARAAEYLPPEWRNAAEASPGNPVGAVFNEFVEHEYSSVRTHSFEDAPVSSARDSYPVVIMRAGNGALVTELTTLAEDLASHGYVVAGFDAPWRTRVVVLPDGRVVRRPPENNPESLQPIQADRLAGQLVGMWSEDTGFALDELTRMNAGDRGGKFGGRLDMQSVGVFGHSLGGATAVRFCHDDPRCKAGIDIDGALYGDASVIRDGLRRPFMFLLSDHGESDNADDRQVLANILKTYDRLPPNDRYLITLRGAHHFSFTDEALLKSQVLMRLLRIAHVIPRLDGRQGLAMTTYYVRTFFDVYLKDLR